MTTQDLQSSLLDWFSYKPLEMKNLRSIEYRCINISSQYNPDKDSKYAKYNLFYPLLRTGVIEFYGQDRFALAPSCALFNDSAILLVNVPTFIVNESINDLVQKTYPGIIVYKKKQAIINSLQKHGIPVRSFNLKLCMLQIPSLESIIFSWENSKVGDSSRFQYYQSQWSYSYQDGQAGIYRKSSAAYAERVCRLPDGEWKLIPQRADHIDAFPIAVCWSKKMSNSLAQINYDTKLCLLEIRENFFPILVERLLTLNSLLHLNHEYSHYKRNYFLDTGDFSILNKLTAHQILSK